MIGTRCRCTTCAVFGHTERSRMTRSPVLRIALAAVLAFVAARGALHLATYSLPLSNDDAVPVIQARLLLQGELVTTLINQPYNGTLDTWLLAPLVALLPA